MFPLLLLIIPLTAFAGHSSNLHQHHWVIAVMAGAKKIVDWNWRSEESSRPTKAPSSTQNKDKVITLFSDQAVYVSGTQPIADKHSSCELIPDEHSSRRWQCYGKDHSQTAIQFTPTTTSVVEAFHNQNVVMYYTLRGAELLPYTGKLVISGLF